MMEMRIMSKNTEYYIMCRMSGETNMVDNGLYIFSYQRLKGLEDNFRMYQDRSVAIPVQ